MGNRATQIIRQEEAFASLPIIGLTAHALLEERKKGLDAGMNEQITKPIDPNLLYATLAEWVSFERVAVDKQPVTEQRFMAAADVPASGVPHLPGIDTQGSIMRMAGNEGLYLTLLQRFVQSYGNSVVDIEAAFAARDYPLAERLAHTLKGVGASIGAIALQEVSGQLEYAFKLRNDQMIQPLLAPLTAVLAETRQTLMVIMPAEETAAGGAEVVVTKGEVQPLMRTLHALLADDDGEAIDYLDEIWEQLTAVLDRDGLTALQSSVQSFEFEQAVIDLEALAGQADIDMD